MIQISIVTGTYNRVNLLQAMIESVQRQMPVGFTYEFVIVDGGSTDGTFEYLDTVDHCTVIKESTLRGAIKAFCEGAYTARGRYVVLANDDVTFKRNSLLLAYQHLEEWKGCGAVAFADNRPARHKANGEVRTSYMPARNSNSGKPWVVYAQVGMFPRELGDRLHWWGMTKEGDMLIDAKTYGGDNFLSAHIWETGLTVDEVDGCVVYDSVYEDGLRAINESHDDVGYKKLFPYGVDVPKVKSDLSQWRDTPGIRVMYFPIYENHNIQHEQKSGLRDALAKEYALIEIDYLNVLAVIKTTTVYLKQFSPQILLTQFHGASELNLLLIHLFRSLCPEALIVNWNGDYWPQGLTAAPVIEMLRKVDLQLVVNPTVIDLYGQHGIKAAYWQIGYEEPGNKLPDVETHDIVFLGNNYSPERQALGAFLRGLDGVDVGLYGDGWENAQGECLYDFATGKALYRNAKIAIGDNQFMDTDGYVSNRLFQALAAGGAMLMHQDVKGLEVLTGLVAHKHYKPWEDFEELQRYITMFLNDDELREPIAKAGSRYVRRCHSFDVRVRELFDLIETKAARQIGGTVMVNLPGGRRSGVLGMATRRTYMYKPPEPLRIDSRDAPPLLQVGWEIVQHGN